MMIANEEGEWQLELYLPERRAGKLRKALQPKPNEKGTKVPVSYILMTDPGQLATAASEKSRTPRSSMRTKVLACG